ncbi:MULTISPECIES: hypothetical protein [Mesorhizobium]|uniref:hypothetical protein n=1 Tax=Mesorhizobium sp. TaxID=1871066 RepID=UPI0004944F5C|nr:MULTISPECIES: hypothetical protein [Mesorhizobium]RWM71586.1 MAG: hypothetical protein EOR82_17320 [Mesorhizobium sp.]TIO24753.1 MAG: hypothetical protein E5X83_15950 [Mesorhizobium sp.]TJV56068.1 MAG: hypothetical protein E5X82_25170 [Mesorhizobium sp.]
MQNIAVDLLGYVSETRHLDSQATSAENIPYLAVKTLLSVTLTEGPLPFENGGNRSESRAKARNTHGFVLGDYKIFLVICGEVKRAKVSIEDLAVSRAALLALRSELDALYERVGSNPFTVAELGIER